MKKILTTIALFLGAVQILSAIPAYPGWIQVTQPDGSVISIRIHGDEWFHYITNERGQVIAQGPDGFFREAEMPTREQREEAEQMRRSARRMQAQAAAAAPSMTKGKHKIPVVLVAFSDRDFVINNPQAAFSNLLNQEGYSANGGTGSVRDFYLAQSKGAYEPEFDVYGPVTLDNTSAYYAEGQTSNARLAVRDACAKLDSEVDFSQYDSDSDGYVDMILMYYAGHNQAEGGGSDTIWPHQSQGGTGTFDGVRISRYFCTSELRGASGNSMCGVGTTCHEFAHSLGLPDFYDTDYGENGEAGGLYSFSTMCSGSYLNNGRTPPNFNAEERIMLGWMDGLTEITEAGGMTILPITENVAYKTPTTMDGEYFLYECRVRSGWDRYLPGAGLLVYHVDKADRESLYPDAGYWSSYYRPSMLWSRWESTNAINAFGAHPCFYAVPSASQSSLDYSGSESNIPFPGSRNIKTYTPVDWQEAQSDFRFTDIAFNGSQVTLTVKYTSVPGVTGIIRNTSARPVRGATVAVYGTGSQPIASTTTDVDGLYSLENEALADGTFTVKVTCDGYMETSQPVQIGRRIVTCDIYIRKEGESPESTFIKYDPEGTSYGAVGYNSTSVNHAAAMHLTAEEVAAHAGKQIKLISFQPSGSASSTAASAYVFIEENGRRVFTQKVENLSFESMNTVNIVGQEYLISAGTELYIGYGLVGCSEASPILVQPSDADHAGYIGRFNQNGANSWSIIQTSDGTFYAPIISAAVGEKVEPELGFNHIANPGNGRYAAGDRFELSLVRYEDDAPSTVAWTFDGQGVQADAVTLTAGSHTVEAHLTYPDGSAEVIRLALVAE